MPEAPVVPPDALVQFARSARFAEEAGRMAEATGTPDAAMRERLLHAMAVMGALASRPLAEHDWHRLLDAAVLTTRS